MKNLIKYLFLVLLFVSVSFALQAQDEIVYQHPTLGIQFTASPNWTPVFHPGEKMEYELVNQNNNMHMKLWFSHTDKPVLEYLRSEVCQDGLITGEGPFATVLDNHHAFGICAIFSEMRRPFKVMLIAMPTDEGMYLIRFKCPEECYQEHESQIQKLLSTISMAPVVRRTEFYAHCLLLSSQDYLSLSL